MPFGESVAVVLSMDFFAASLGGGVEVVYGSERLAFESYRFDSEFPDDPSHRVAPDDASPENPLIIAFHEFDMGLQGGIVNLRD